MAQDVQLLQLDDDTITANGANVLAFDAGIDWDITRVEGVSGMLGGGLYNMELKGSGWVALVSDGPPVMIELDGSETFADPQAAITWSSGLSTSVKTDVNVKTLVGRRSGETVQIALLGKGVAPDPALRGSGHGRRGGTASGGGSVLGQVLGR